MVDWNSCAITEPPITRNIPIDKLRLIAKNGIGSIMDYFNLPCHTQAVERCVKVRK